MRLFVLALALSVLSCGNSDSKQKELELKERELALREKELQQKDSSGGRDTVEKNNPKLTVTGPVNISITYQSQEISPNVDMAYYKGKGLIFFYDEKTKGKIVIDNVTYPLTSEKRTDNGKFVNYTYTGTNINIKAINGKFEDMGEEEERDVYSAKFKTMLITTEKGSLTINNVDLFYSLMDGM